MQRDNVTKKVNILGDANVDMILNLSDKQNLAEPSLFSGGSSANVASGLSKLGIDVSFFGSLTCNFSLGKRRPRTAPETPQQIQHWNLGGKGGIEMGFEKCEIHL